MGHSFLNYEIRNSWMGTDFARDLAMKWFDWSEDDLDDYCGLDTKGRHQGNIYWLTVTKGGWCGGVFSKGMKCIALIVDEKLIAFKGKALDFENNFNENLLKKFSDEVLSQYNYEYVLKRHIEKGYFPKSEGCIIDYN